MKILFIVCLSGALTLGAIAADISAEPGARQVRVPLVADISNSVAGAQFAFLYTDGLSFAAYEPSDAVKNGSLTPVVEKNGTTHLGFFSGFNIFAPQNGKLDMGYLVFDYTGQDRQSVTILEIELVEIVDNNTTANEFFGPITVEISREGGGTAGESSKGDSGEASGGNPNGNPGWTADAGRDADSGDSIKGGGSLWWVVAIVLLVVATVIVLILVRKKRKGNQGADSSGEAP